MPTKRTLDGSVRRGALLAGIPLLIAGAMPYSLEPLVFLWGTPDNLGDWKLLAPAAAGILLLAIAAIPGLPRLLRGLFILGLSGAALVLVMETLADSTPIRFDLDDPRDIVFLGAILLAATGEIMMQGFKTSKVFATIAFIGWTAYLAQAFLPWEGGEPVAINAVEMVADFIDDGEFGLLNLGMVWPTVVLLLSLLLALNGALFAFLRLVRSTQGMLRGPFKSAWAAILMAGLVGLMMLGMMLLVAIDGESLNAIVVSVAVGLFFFGVGVGLASGLAHTILGFIPAPKGGEDMARPVYQPEVPQLPQAQPQFSQPKPQFPQPQPQPQFQPPQFQEPRPAQPSFGSAGGGGGGWPQGGGGGGFGGGGAGGGQPAFGSGGGAGGAGGGFGGGAGGFGGQPAGGGSAGGGGWAQAQPPAGSGSGGSGGGSAGGGGWAQAQPQPVARPAGVQPQGFGGGQPQGFGGGQPQGFGGDGGGGAAKAGGGWEQGPTQINPRVTGNLPRGADLQAYPGYPGYVVCPQCRGGVATNSPKCSHCGQQIAW